MDELISLVIVNYNSGKFLKKCLDSVFNQKDANIEIIVIDNKSTDSSLEVLNSYQNDKVTNIEVVANTNNLGYAGGANQGIRIAKGEFIVVMNPDIVMEEDYLKNCYKFIKNDESIAVVSGKLLKYDFEKAEKLKVIDSTGISITRARKFYDRGQNNSDEGQYEKIERIFGVCGAVPFYRKSALEKVCVNSEYYDEDFFAYKEDIDLCWRFNLYGYKCMYYPKAVAYHGRGMNSADKLINTHENRKKQSQFLRGISFRNHYIMLLKNETNYSWKRDRVRILFRFLTFIGYSIIFERFNLKYLKEIKELWPKIKAKRYIIQQNTIITKDEFFDLFGDNS